MRPLPILFSLLILTSSVFAASENETQASKKDRYRDIAAQIKLVGEVFRGINQRYVEPIDVEDFIQAGIEGMLGTLDPYTVYFEPDEVKNLEEITKGEFSGVGIEIGLRGKEKELTVISPMSDTPAYRIGVKSGDIIIAVDGKSTKGFTISDAAKHIRGEEGTEVTLTISRRGYDRPLEYTIVRANIRVHDVAYTGMLDDEIGYIKLIRFSSHASNELRQALKDIITQNPKGLILDLRYNPGGLLPSAVEVSQEFLKPGLPIVSTKGRYPRSVRSFKASGEPLMSDIPLVVLVNGGSASASEIVAGALQDHDRAVILGTTTFGKGLVQSVLNLSDGAALKVTTARYYTPSGRLIQRDRLRDDDEGLADANEGFVPFVASTDTSSADTSVEKFYTDSGREVFGGGGITPDIILEPPFPDPVRVEMYRRDLFFMFVDNWLTRNVRPDTVIVTNEMLADFDRFIDSVEFTPPIPGEEQLETLRKIGETDSLNDEYFALLDRIESELKHNKREFGPQMREFVYQSIDMELASALGNREWRIRASFDEDVQLTEAKAILKDKVRYLGELQGTSRADAGDGNN